jgi:hypothetical protein
MRVEKAGDVRTLPAPVLIAPTAPAVALLVR